MFVTYVIQSLKVLNLRLRNYCGCYFDVMSHNVLGVKVSCIVIMHSLVNPHISDSAPIL